MMNRRVYKSRAQALAMQSIRQVLSAAEPKQRRLVAAANRQDVVPSENGSLSALCLLTPDQVAAIATVRELAKEIARLSQLINQQNAVYELGFSALQLSELTGYLSQIDRRIEQGQVAARRLGVAPVVDKLKHATPYPQN